MFCKQIESLFALQLLSLFDLPTQSWEKTICRMCKFLYFVIALILFLFKLVIRTYILLSIFLQKFYI